MPNTASLTAFKDPNPCICKGIRRAHLEAALALGHYDDHKTLYAATLSVKKSDPSARVTGRENENGEKYCCGTCSSGFRDAVAGQTVQASEPAPVHIMIPITAIVSAANAATFPKESCHTCPKAISGACTPQQPLSCGS